MLPPIVCDEWNCFCKVLVTICCWFYFRLHLPIYTGGDKGQSQNIFWHSTKNIFFCEGTFEHWAEFTPELYAKPLNKGFDISLLFQKNIDQDTKNNDWHWRYWPSTEHQWYLISDFNWSLTTAFSTSTHGTEVQHQRLTILERHLNWF